MADVRITFSPDRAAAAERLREAVSAEGYDVATAEISDVEDLIATEDRQQTGTATLLIWSRPLVLSALRPGMLRQLRQQRMLIEVSADGVGPDGGEGDNHVILISGWRGQPFHPGWQRLAGELKRLCGAPKEAPVAPAGLKHAELPAAPLRAPAEATPSNGRPPTGKLALGLLAALGLFGAGFGTSSWLRSASETQQPPPAEMQTNQEKRAPVTADPKVRPNVATVGPSVPPGRSGFARSEPAIVEPRSAGAPSTAAPTRSDDGERSKTAPRTASKASGSRLTKGGSPVRRDTKLYSRKNSETMRLFCQGSGRSTPQCRTFLRSTRGSRR